MQRSPMAHRVGVGNVRPRDERIEIHPALERMQTSDPPRRLTAGGMTVVAVVVLGLLVYAACTFAACVWK